MFLLSSVVILEVALKQNLYQLTSNPQPLRKCFVIIPQKSRLELRIQELQELQPNSHPLLLHLL